QGLLADLLGHQPPIHLRQANVEQDNVRGATLHRLHSARPIGGDFDLVPVQEEQFRQASRRVLVILDDQYTQSMAFHRCYLVVTRRGCASSCATRERPVARSATAQASSTWIDLDRPSFPTV